MDAVSHEKKWAAAILFLALGLRLWGIQFGLPGLFHADEPIVLNHALAYGTGDFNPHFFKIPPLISYLLFGVFGVYYLAGKLLGYFSGTADFETLFYSDPSSFYLLARTVFGALAGTLTVLALYRVVRRHFGPVRALTAALFLAVCFLHVSDSHYLYADIPLLLVMVFAWGVFWDIVDGNSNSLKHAAAGALIGLAAAVKYNGVFIGLAYAPVLLGLETPFSEKIKKGLLAAAAAIAVFALLNPYSLIDTSFFLGELKEQSLSQSGAGWLHHLTYSLPGAVGFPLLAAGFLGASLVFLKDQTAEQRRKRLALVIFTAAYYAVLACSGQPYPRYVLPLLPGLLFFAADFLCGVSEEKKRRALFAAGLLLLAVFPLTKSVLWDRLMSAPDVRVQTKAWIENHIAAGSSLALDWEFYMPRLGFTQEQLQEKQRQLKSAEHFQAAQMRRLEVLENRAGREGGYALHFLVPQPQVQKRFLMASPAVPYDLEALKALGIQYALLLPGVQPDAADAFYSQIQKEGRLIQTLSPYRNGQSGPLDPIAMTGGPFTWAEITQRARNGRTIWIYQIL